MQEASISPRDKADLYSFENLIDQGLELLQQLSGDLWTDYNLHDPGVTLLEQLCFALTDIAFRSERELAQYLVDGCGRVDLAAQGLYGPSKVLSSGPVTADDFERLFLDAVPGLSRVIVDVANSRCGQYVLAQDADLASRDQIQSTMNALYQSTRPLCHNATVSFEEMESDCVALRGEIEVESGYHVEQVLADILLCAESYLSPAPRFIAYDRLLGEGCTLDQVLQGPFLANGMVERSGPVTLLASTLAQQLMALRGVKAVRHLRFKTESGELLGLLENSDEQIFSLRHPDSEQQSALTLMQNGKTAPINFQRLGDHLEQQRMRLRAKPFSISVDPVIFPSVEREYWPLDESYPMARQLPGIYAGAANHTVLPSDRHQQAHNRQLNGYLMLFEQLVANAFAGLADARKLFSTDGSLQQSYFVRALDYPEARALYRSGERDELERQLRQIIAGQDHFLERRNRALDFLLALYGEAIPEADLLRLDNSADEEEIQRDLIRAKIALLKQIPAIGYRRLLAQDVSQPLPWDDPARYGMNMSGVQLKASLLIGLWDIRQRSLMSIYEQLSLPLVDDQSYQQLTMGDSESRAEQPEQAADRFVREHFRPAMAGGDEEWVERDEMTVLLAELKQLGLFRGGLHTELLRAGIDSARYRVGHSSDRKSIVLAFRFGERRWVTLARFDEVKAARQAARNCQRFLRGLNRYGEGMHIVEHNLLNRTAINPIDDTVQGHRISVVLPNWLCRFSSTDFQQFVEQAVLQSCPAHVMCQFHWLNASDMGRFEVFYRRWYQTLSVPGRAARDSETSGAGQPAEALRQFLQALSQRGGALQ